MVDLALKMILDDKARFAITVLGVGFAVALVLTQVGLFFGLLDNASVTIDRPGMSARFVAAVIFTVSYCQG